MEKEVASVRSVLHSVFYDYLGKTGTGLLDFIGHLIVALLILVIGFRLIKYAVNFFIRQHTKMLKQTADDKSFFSVYNKKKRKNI